MKKLTLFLVAMTMSLLSFAQTQMSGTYTVGTGGSYDYSSMADAGMAIKEAEFTGDVTLLICTDLTETINTGIVNKSEYTLTIRPDKDENRTITYTTATDNTGPTGVFVIGGDMTKTPGSTIGWASVPTKNVIVDGAAEGKTTPRLKITNNKWGTNVLLYGDVQDVIIRNCILVGRSSSTAYSLVFRSERYSETSKNIGPKNCVAENCIIESASTQSQVVYCQGNEANSYAGYPTNITIRNCSITSHLRGIFLYGVNNFDMEGCVLKMLATTAGYMCHGVLGTTTKGVINIKGNKFIKNTTKNASAGEYGLQTITASGGATEWVIENNYFAGYDALASGTTTKESRLVGIRCGDYCVVRHNTFHMPKLTYAPATPLVSTQAVALLWLAGSHKYPVQNNIFVCEETAANVSLIRGGLNENVTGNVFYHKGGNAAIVAAAPSCMTFADLETSYPTQAATSKWKNVTFTDAANGDLSLVGKSNGDPDLAVNRLAEVLTDITGKNRREKTCAGAYEGREPLPSSITLNAHPVKDYSASIVGTMKRAIQNGENTIVLTHEANGTAHIYNIAHATKTVTEISQEGVVAVDPDNAGDFLAISDIALTADGKLVACNYMLCQNTDSYVDAGYKRGTTRFYIWDNIDGNPTLWFTSQQSVNYYRAKVGYTMALKGTSDDAWVIVAGFNNNATGPARFDHYHIVNGSKSTTSPSKAANMSYSAIGSTYEISASPLADGNWVLDGELAVPTEFVESKDNKEMTIFTSIPEGVLGKKYNGATYLANYNDHHLMIAPYAGADGKLAGVKVLGITLGFDDAISVATSTDLSNAIDATAAAATAYVDGDGDLTIYLIADAKVYTFSQKVLPKYTITAKAEDNTKGYVTGGGTYYAGETVTLKAVANTGYYFTQWNDGNKDNPRTIEVNGDAEYIAEFAEAHPRVYAYDLNVVDNGNETYTFSFKPNADAVSGNLLLYSEDGVSVVQTYAISTAIVANTAIAITLNKTDLPNQSNIPWAIELSGNAIPAFAETFADSDYRFARAHAVVDNSPESEYFGRVYVADRRNTKSNSKVYVYNPDFTDLEATNLGLATAGYSRPAVGADGTLYLTGYTDGAEAGIFVVNPADLTKCTQFFNGTYDAAGLYINNGKEIGSSTSGVGVYGSGKDAVLYTMMEDGSNANVNSGRQPIVKYQIGQENGTVLKQWSDEPTWWVNYPAKAADKSYNFGNNDFAATAKGVWVSQNKSNPDDRPEIAFVDKTGTIQFMQNSKPCLGGGMTVNADNTVLYIVEDGKILEYAITWNENKPSLTLSNTYPISLQYISTLSVDYAGNLIACAGTTYTTTDNNVMKVVRFTLPTDDNHIIVPAPKTKSVKLGKRYTVTVVVNDETMGEAIGGGSYKEGETATIAASAKANHRFVKWTKGGEDVSNVDSYSFEVTEDVTYTANFEPIPQYTISAEPNDPIMGTVSGYGTYYEGDDVTLTATAKAGYVFVKWSDEETDESRTFTASENVTLQAIFKVATPRAWAYDLKKGEDSDNYTFTFTATSDGNATILFTDKDGNAVAPTQEVVGAVTAGETKTVSIDKDLFTGTKDIYWSVKVDGAPIEKMAEITDPTKGIYDIVAPQGIAVDNNTDSKHFGQVYVAAATNGTVSRGAQTRGIFVYDPILNELNSPNAGFLPANATLTSNTRQAIHRVAVNPTNNQVAFAYNISGSSAIWSMNPENLAGDAVNLIEGAGITKANSLCFDESGALYVMDNANTSTGGKIYKIKDGVANVFAVAQTGYYWGVEENAMTPDGRGGLWIAQNRWQVDLYPALSHVDKNGNVDFAVTSSSPEALKALFPHDDNNASYRGQCAYYVADDILAFGGNKEAVLFKITYDANDVPTNLEKLMSTGKLGTNIDGLAFDYAGDLYVASENTKRFYKFVVPTNTNTCTVPAPESQIIQKEARYTVTVAVNDNAMGTATGGGEYIAGETATLEATPAAHHKFVNWTYGSETSTNNPLELVVEGKITVTANFEPVQYTLIAPTNDENKGTVSGAGAYNYGTEVTLTATPKEGHKLLYWSDRSTENPRTITMTKNEAISAYFVKEYTEEPTFKIEKMWENTKVPASTGEGFQAVGWDGKIYMQNKAAGKIQIFSNETDAPVDYATSGIGQKIAVDEAGNMIVCNSTFAAATNNKVLIYPKGSTEGKVVSFTLLQDGRCDFFSASGNIYSAEGGYVYFYCQSTTVVNRVKIANGELVSVDVVGNNITAGNSQNHVMVDIFGNLVAHSRSAVINATINVHTNESMPFALIDHKYGTLGGCSFELGGKELWAYHAGATNYSSEWNIYNMTDDVFLSDDDFYAVDKEATTNYACNWLNVQVVNEYTAYIYQFCPKKAAAVWKVTCTTEKTVTIDENADNTTALENYDGEEVTATVKRNFDANKYLTLTLPFDMNATQIRNVFGNATVYALYNVVEYNAEEVHLQFTPVSTITAGTPYILKTAASGYDAEDGFTMEGVAIDLSLKPVTSGTVTMVPVLDAGGTLNQSDEYFLSNNALYCAGTYPRDIMGLRAYFESTSPLPIRARVVFQDNAATSIPMVETQPANQVRKVLKDGQLIIIRGEEMYNMQGQRME